MIIGTQRRFLPPCGSDTVLYLFLSNHLLPAFSLDCRKHSKTQPQIFSVGLEGKWGDVNIFQKIPLEVNAFFFFYFSFYIYLFFDRDRAQWGRVRERETQNLKQAPGSELSAQSPTQGSNSQTARL